MTIELAGCVVRDDYGRILLLHRNTSQHTHWELPGGKVEQGETHEAAAVREVEEELGITVRLTDVLGTCEFEDQGKDYRFTWFSAVVIDADPTLRETHLFDDLDYFDVDDLMSLALSANMQVLLEKITNGEVAFRT